MNGRYPTPRYVVRCVRQVIVIFHAHQTIVTSNVSPAIQIDTQWFLVIIALLCVGIALVVVAKIKPLLHWIRSNHGYFMAQKIVTVPPRTVDDDVSKPVQEMCGKCDHCIDLCIKD
ncbi:uncharacterized protein FYW61_005781 [Anableps anableps]